MQRERLIYQVLSFFINPQSHVKDEKELNTYRSNFSEEKAIENKY